MARKRLYWKLIIMRVGVLTFHCAENFGAVLQAYALCQALRHLGCDPCVIDYRPEYLLRPYAGIGRRPWVVARNVLRKWRYYRFRRNFIPTTRRIYWNAEDLRTYPPEVDVCICGSDQIWNKDITGGELDPAFLLDFLPSGVKRIAYAPSIGGSVVPEHHNGFVATRLDRFNALSAREPDAEKLMHHLTGRNITNVLDPTFLTSEYSAITSRHNKPRRGFIVAYSVQDSAHFPLLIRVLKQQFDLPVVNIGTFPVSSADYNYNHLGPSEWLGWLKSATFVFTNSFHGTAFSIHFQRNFLCFSHHASSGQNLRLTHLLSQLGLSSRYIENPKNLIKDHLSMKDINYEQISPLLCVLAENSRDFLKNSIFPAIPTGTSEPLTTNSR